MNLCFFIAECTRTNSRPWSDSCSSCTKVMVCVTPVAPPPAATIVPLDLFYHQVSVWVILEQPCFVCFLIQTQLLYETILSQMDCLFDIITFCFAGTLQEYQRRMKKLDQQYKERLRNAGMPPLSYWCIRTELVCSRSLRPVKMKTLLIKSRTASFERHQIPLVTFS